MDRDNAGIDPRKGPTFQSVTADVTDNRSRYFQHAVPLSGETRPPPRPRLKKKAYYEASRHRLYRRHWAKSRRRTLPLAVRGRLSVKMISRGHL